MDPRVVAVGRLRVLGAVIGILGLAAGGLAASLDGGTRWAVVAAAIVAAVLGIVVIATARAIPLTSRDTGPDDTSASDLDAVAEQLDRLARGVTGSGGERSPALTTLTPHIKRVADRIDRLTEARARAVAAERDLDHARKVYRAILPLSTRTAHGVIKVAGHCVPADDCGGDWWVYRKLSDGRLLIAVGDATGHGVHAAMIDCAAHGAVETLAAMGEQHLTPEQVLNAINRAIRVPGNKEVGMTCFVAFVDPGRKLFEYANAGHNFPMIGKIDERRVINHLDVLTGTGDRLGDDTEERPLEVNTGSRQLAAGDMLLIFTDGLVERSDKQGRLFGHRRLQKALVGQVIDSELDGLGTVRDTIVAAVNEFAAGTEMEDDMTFVLCMFDPDAPASSDTSPTTTRR